MNENGASNVTQILKACQRFLSIYENPLWAKTCSVEDIKSAFKLGNFVEKTVITFQEKKFLDKFMVLFELWGKQNNLKNYSDQFFLQANDHLLVKLFKFPNIKESSLDIGVRVYTSLYSKDRFKDCMKTLLLTSNSLKAIADFVNTSVSDKTIIENTIILNKWNDYCKLGLREHVKSEIECYLSLYKVEEKLPRLISLLALKETQKECKGLILECLLNKMSDRSLLSKTFWLTLFKNVNIHHINKTCQNFPEFLESLLNFIEYIGAMMTRDNSSDIVEWISDPSVSFCNEITFFELVIFLKTMCCEHDVKNTVLDRLEQAKEYSNTELWDQIISDISK